MRRRLPDILIIVLFFLLPLVMFWQQTLGGYTLLPTENLYQYEPYATYREVVNAPEIPHNHLLSDLVLQNYQWKSFIRESINQREIPLWNPHQFSGIPFMAAGQQSTLYPLSIIYYVMPLTSAYGWFTVVNLWLAGVFMYLFLRGLGVARIGGVIAGITYQLCGFFLASAVFPMIVGAAVWMPLILLMAEYVIQRKPLLGKPTTAPWISIGAMALACNIFAGHIEMTIYTLLIVGFYGGLRLVFDWWQKRKSDGVKQFIASSGWLGLMVALGLGLGALQLIPLYEVADNNWRSERSDLQTVLGYAHPPRDAVQFVMPNFYGSPAIHSYVDVFSGETITDFTNLDGNPINFIDWGIKNYVESALYLGILPLALAGFALFIALWLRRKQAYALKQHHIIFGILTLISLTFMFGLPTYRVIYVLPGINQLNSPFRWIFGVTLGIAVLAGFGADALYTATQNEDLRKWTRRFGYGLIFAGVMILGGLLASRVLFDQLESFLQRIVENMELAGGAFSHARMFYSFQFPQVLIFGVATLLSGVVFWLASLTSPPNPLSINREGESISQRHNNILNSGGESQTRSKASSLSADDSRMGVNVPSLILRGGDLGVGFWTLLAVFLVAIDLMLASWGFNPASDPLLLDFTPPAIQWLQEQKTEEGAFRFTTLDAPALGHDTMLQANMTMRYGLDDVRGYDSIISSQYVDYMRGLMNQPGLDFNRVAPIYLDVIEAGGVNWDALNALNVRYLVTHIEVTLPEDLTTPETLRSTPQFEVVYEDDAVRIYRNNRAFLRTQLLEPLDEQVPNFGTEFAFGTQTTITRDTGRERFIDFDLNAVAMQYLVVSETYADGWRAFIRPQGAGEDFEQPLAVELVFGNLQGVRLDSAEIADLFADSDLTEAEQVALNAGLFTVRMVYSPTSFQVGLFGSIMSGALVMFVVGIWLWQTVIMPEGGADTSLSRVARNSIAPIILNLFNRGIDFVFAFVMLRILGPTDAGIYFYAVIIFVWFDILTNFGLDVFLIREASRERDRAGYFFLNTSYLRLSLMVACVPLLVGFLLIRQATIDPQLNQEAILAIGLLYIGLAPGSLSKGLTSLYYGFEKAEYPAAVATISTINKSVFGLIALLLGYGIVGLAGVSIFVNIITLGVLLYGARGMIGKIRQRTPDRKLLGNMVNDSWALMLNHFLATIFFQIDVVILEAIKGARIVGLYSVAYKWLLAINIVPAFFTQALLPVMSRLAHEDRERLKSTYQLAIKLLIGLAIPTAVVFTFLAESLTWLLGGSEYLPDGAIALQLMIWSIPIGWMNSLTQYVLIALDLQKRITRAFIVAVLFNIITNTLLIPEYGYRAAALTTIASEMVLLIPFGVLLQGAIGRVSWLDLVWRPIVAGGVMFGVMLVGWNTQPIIAFVVGCTLYPLILLALRPLSPNELNMITPILPTRLRRLLHTS